MTIDHAYRSVSVFQHNMAANLGDARKRSNTGGSDDSEDRVVLLSGEDMSNVHSESELSDNNDDGHSTKLISEKAEIFTKDRSVLQSIRHFYKYYCPQRYIVQSIMQYLITFH